MGFKRVVSPRLAPGIFYPRSRVEQEGDDGGEDFGEADHNSSRFLASNILSISPQGNFLTT